METTDIKDVIRFSEQNKDKVITYTAKVPRDQWSVQQCRLCYSNIAIISEDSGFTPEQMKIVLKKWATDCKKVKCWEYLEVKWVQAFFPNSLKKLSKEEMTLFIKYIYEVWEFMNLRMKYPEDKVMDHVNNIF